MMTQSMQCSQAASIGGMFITAQAITGCTTLAKCTALVKCTAFVMAALDAAQQRLTHLATESRMYRMARGAPVAYHATVISFLVLLE